MGARTDWRSNRLRPSPEGSSEMVTRTICSSQPVTSVAGGTRPRFRAIMVGGMRWRCVTQLVERCPDLAERGAIPLALDAPTETDAAGTNSSGPRRMMPSVDDAIGLIPMTSYG